ncbi:MAG: IS110 family transposase [Cyclobacteriaceae bacterium]|nr:IS110 family transposase [Cyclobacteriaceae bacterium]
MSKKKVIKSKKVKINEFTILHPNAAGIDVSSKDHVVALPPDRDKQTVRTFGCFTCDLKAIAIWLLSCNIDTVAMESTGIYWKQLFVVLEEHGIEVYLVNSKHVKNVTGKKTDEEDAQWIQRLHTCGLLSNSFQPKEDVRTLRSLVRQRKTHCNNKSKYVNRMVKSLEEMNIKLNLVLSDITSVSGQKIVAAITQGERSVEKLMTLMHHKVKAPREDIFKALEGCWREECIFELQQTYDLYNFIQQKIGECDKKIEVQLEIIAAKANNGDVTGLQESAKKKTCRKNEFGFNVNAYLKAIIGTDASKIYGISDDTALILYAETGGDLCSFKTANHFASWAGLAPNNRISGGKIISSHLPKKKHPIKKALLRAANSVYRSDNTLGDYYRKMKARLGPKGAKCAVARKILVIYYHMVTKKQPFNIELLKQQQHDNKQKRVLYLKKQLADLEMVA